MDVDKVKALIDAYTSFHDRMGSDDELRKIGQSMNEETVRNYINFSVQNDIQPDIVLRAIYEAASEPKHTTEAIVSTIRCLIKGRFATQEKAENTANVVRKIAPQVCSTKTCYKLMGKLWVAANDIVEEKSYIAEQLLSIIPPLYNKIYNDTSPIKIGEDEMEPREMCANWINNEENGIFSYKIKSYMTPLIIDMLSDLPLSIDNLKVMVDFIFQSTTFRELHQVAEKIFQPLSRSKKLTNHCIKLLILSALKIEKEGINKQAQLAQCELIKKLSLVSTTNRTVLESITSLLSSKTELPHHFTPFTVSLSLYLSKMRPKINDCLFQAFEQQLKDDQMRQNSRLLRHLYNLFSEELAELSLESVVKETVELTRLSLESNIRFLVEFAFKLVDEANTGSDNPFKRQSTRIKESSSEFVSTTYRQVEIGVKIINQCVKIFPVEAQEMFRQIVQRVITKMQNSEALIRCLNSEENPQMASESLVEIIEHMQHIELTTLEQIMRISIPKIIDDMALVDRVVLAAKKSFCNRSEAAKLNGLAAMFYLIQPRSDLTFTQTIKQHVQFGERISTISNEDLQFEIFSLIQRGFTQSSNVQADAYMFIPLLLQQNTNLSQPTVTSFLDQLKEQIVDNEFPLILKRSLPYLIQSISDTIHVLPKSIKEEDEWKELEDLIDKLAKDISEIDLVVFTEEMKIISKPEERDILIATLAVLFNYAIIHEKDHEVALNLFNTYDRIIHKVQESEKLRKDTQLRSTFQFKFSLNTDLLVRLFAILRSDDEDFSRHYGIQLYTLERAQSIIKEVPVLRVEYRIRRLQLAMQLGKMTIDALDKVKWCDAPSGMKQNQSLQEILTENFKKLFQFVFSTYDKETVVMFLVNCSLMTQDQTILAAENNLFKSVKYFLASSQAKCADNFCQVLESLSLFDQSDSKFFEKITKLMNKVIQQNKSQSHKLIRLARYFSPAAQLNWLKEASQIIVNRLVDEESSTSAPLHELIQTITSLTNEIQWSITNWISKVNSENSEKSAEITQHICDYLNDIAHVGSNLMDVDFTRFQIKYYEDIVKFIIEYLAVMNKLLKKVEEVPNSSNESLSNVIRYVTSEFGDKVAKFTLKSQNPADNEKNARQNDFDAKTAPKIIYNLEKLMVETSKLIDKKLLDPDIKDTFCHIKGTDVKMSSRSKKKQEKIDPEPEPEPDPEPESDNRNGEEEDTEDIQNGQQANDEDEDEDDDSIREDDDL